MFIFEVEPAKLFEERTRQFRQCGIPASAIFKAQSAITDMWSMEAGGWVPEWAALAEKAQADDKLLLASQLWGAARFPSMATADRRFAYEMQLECYLDASGDFGVPFSRRTFDVPYSGGTTQLTAHLFGAARRGVVVISGGVDTWKMDLHRLMVMTARMTRMLVVAIDMPGTGESPLNLAPDAEDVLIGLIEVLRAEYPRSKLGYMGLSFGGHWAAKLAMLGAVDAAVAIGGPTGLAGEKTDVLNLPYGMAGIIGNALGLDELPDQDYVNASLDGFSLRELLPDSAPTPLYAINGAKDQYIPQGDTLGLAERPNTKVWLVKNGTHCAPERFPLVIMSAWFWLQNEL